MLKKVKIFFKQFINIFLKFTKIYKNYQNVQKL